MGIIKHLGRTVNSGSAFTPAVPTSRTFYFSEGSNGAALNENVIWYVDGASTNDQYPYTYNATAEFTAELRFQNGYTISSVNDVVLSNDFSDPQYEWSISKSLNAGGDILTLTFTPDADDFNGNPVTIVVDENNTVVIDPTPPYDQYDPTSLGFSADGRIDGFYKNGPVSYSGANTPIPYTQLYGRNDTLTEGSNFNEYKIHRFFSELDSNGLPTIGSYARGYGGMLTTEGYDINISSNFGTSNVSEDGTVFKFKNVIRYEVAPNGYSYVAEIIDEIISEPSSAPEYDGVAILQIRDDAFQGGNKLYTTPESGYIYAAETGGNVITFRHQMNLYLGAAREYITEVHISSDGSDWDIYNIASFDSDSIYIEGTFTRNIGANPYIRFKFEGDVIFDGFMLNFTNYNTVADLRSIASGNSIQVNSMRVNDLFNNTGEYSYQQFVGKKMQLVNDAGVAVDMIYEISEVELIEHATQATSNQHRTYMSPSYVPFSPNTYKYFKFPTTGTA